MFATLMKGIVRAVGGGGILLTMVACQGENPTDPGDEFPYDIVLERRDGTAGPPDLFVLDVITGDERRLLDQSLGGMHPSGSLDGTRVAFVRTDDEFNDEIFLVDADGTGLTNISNDADDDVMPAISPGGSRVAFVTNREGFQDIFLVNTDGSGVRRVTPADPSPAVTTEWWPAWAPNSQLIAYSSTIEGTPDIWTTRVDAPLGVPIRITGTLDTDLHPTWSEDGARIAFERRDANTGEIDIVVLTLSSGTAQTIRLSGQQLAPSWSPDGSLIAFASNHEDTSADFEIYTMSPDGTKIARHTDNGLNDFRPTWLAKR